MKIFQNLKTLVFHLIFISKKIKSILTFANAQPNDTAFNDTVINNRIIISKKKFTFQVKSPKNIEIQ